MNTIGLKKKEENSLDFETMKALYKEFEEQNPEEARARFKVDMTLLKTTVERGVRQNYGKSYNATGLQGILAQIIHKCMRLRNSIYDERTRSFSKNSLEIITESLTEELEFSNKGVAEHVIDQVNYSKLFLGELLITAKEFINEEAR